MIINILRNIDNKLEELKQRAIIEKKYLQSQEQIYQNYLIKINNNNQIKIHTLYLYIIHGIKGWRSRIIIYFIFNFSSSSNE